MVASGERTFLFCIDPKRIKKEEEEWFKVREKKGTGPAKSTQAIGKDAHGTPVFATEGKGKNKCQLPIRHAKEARESKHYKKE